MGAGAVGWGRAAGPGRAGEERHGGEGTSRGRPLAFSGAATRGRARPRPAGERRGEPGGRAGPGGAAAGERDPERAGGR